MMHITSKKGSIQLRALLAGTVDIVPFPAAASQSRARIRLLLATPTQRRTHTGTSLGSGSTPTSATVSVGVSRPADSLLPNSLCCNRSVDHVVVDLECRQLGRGMAVVAVAFRGRVVVVVL